MPTDFKTPGVYIEEISKLPASVAPVETAIPAFIGHTQKSEKNGKTIPVNTPTRITSLLDYETMFGGPAKEKFKATLTGDGVTEDKTTIAVAPDGDLKEYSMYYNLQMFFGNGGGPCYIVSVGDYDQSIAKGDKSTGLLGGINAVEKIDEVTLLVVPEAISLSDAKDRKVINDAMLAQCEKLQDRFAIMDVKTNTNDTVFNDGNNFRNNDVGIDELKYGAAYYPSIKTAIDLAYDDSGVKITDDRTGAGNGPFHDQSLKEVSAGFSTAAKAASGTLDITDNSKIDGDSVTVNTKTYVEGTDFNKGANATATAGALETAIKNTNDPKITVSKSGKVVTITAKTAGAAGNTIKLGYTDSGTGEAVKASGQTLSGGVDVVNTPADKTLFNNITQEVRKNDVTLYPSSTMAGIYARVDEDRGVWKAPANVGIRLVDTPTVLVTADDQKNLNVDATSGKSINAIRSFTGKGTLVWGARTLAGNDNEWRYVPVRRFYIFVEESVRKATEFVVFEPNDANTWIKAKAMIENFLTTLWRDGALAGAKPEDAFFVKVGLGETMTSLDILEGRMNIEIGMAAVRPAEFIILKFSHKLQTS